MTDDAVYAVRGDLAIAGRLEPGAVIIDRGHIAEILLDPRRGNLPVTVFEAAIVAPGLIDLQVNGGFGAEVGDDPESFRHLAAELPQTGVTSFLPTVISSPASCYRTIFAAFESTRNAPGSRALGLHLEGPFLSPARAGAHPRELIESADDKLFRQLLAADQLKLMTLAPERPGAIDRIHKLRNRGVLVGLGHTDATYEEFIEGINAGATMATHVFNAMSPFAHRAPGAIGTALVDPRVTAGLIADGVHTHRASLTLAVRVKGPDKIALVTDMMSAAGMPPGPYHLGTRHVTVEDGSARLEDGTLAGSVVTLDQAIRNIIRWTDATPAQAIMMASEVPARLLNLPDSGRLALGCRADLVLFDDELNVHSTTVAGEFVFQR